MEKEKVFRKKIVLVVDFDVTITKNDLAYDLLDEYGRPDWRDIEDEIRSGKITLREGIQRELGNLKISLQELVNFTMTRTILDDGAKKFFQWARKEKIPTYILSDGIVQYIQVVFKHFLKISLNFQDDNEWHPQIIANRFKWKDANQVDHVEFPNPPCEHGCANCKPFWITRIKNNHPEAKIIFVGDGYTDRLVAPLVDIIFARKGEMLEQILNAQNVPFYSYDSLLDVLERIQALLSTR